MLQVITIYDEDSLPHSTQRSVRVRRRLKHRRVVATLSLTTTLKSVVVFVFTASTCVTRKHANVTKRHPRVRTSTNEKTFYRTSSEFNMKSDNGGSQSVVWHYYHVFILIDLSTLTVSPKLWLHLHWSHCSLGVVYKCINDSVVIIGKCCRLAVAPRTKVRRQV